jgi:hypothetical protein
MSAIDCRQVYECTLSEKFTAVVDFGDSTAGEETGVLDEGELVSSCTAAIVASPPGATVGTPTLGTPAVNGATVIVLGRTCDIGEAVTVLVTCANDQAYGTYEVRLTATTSLSHIRKRDFIFNVVP